MNGGGQKKNCGAVEGSAYLDVGAFLLHRIGHANAGHQRLVFDQALASGLASARHLNQSQRAASAAAPSGGRERTYLDEIEVIASGAGVFGVDVDVVLALSRGFDELRHVWRGSHLAVEVQVAVPKDDRREEEKKRREAPR